MAFHLLSICQDWWNNLNSNIQLDIVFGILCVFCILFIIKKTLKYVVLLCFISFIFFLLTHLLYPTFWNEMFPLWDDFSIFKKTSIVLSIGLLGTLIIYAFSAYKYIENKLYVMGNNIDSSIDNKDLILKDKCTQSGGTWNENEKFCITSKSQKIIKKILD